VLPARLSPLGCGAVLHRRLPALLALFVRARVQESEVWRQTRHNDGRAWDGDRVELEALPLSDGPDGADEHVSHGTQDM